MIPQDDDITASRPPFERVEAGPVFLPHSHEPRIVAMGLAPMDGPWVDCVSEDHWREHKLAARAQLGRRVYAVLPEAVEAAEEFAELVMDFAVPQAYSSRGLVPQSSDFGEQASEAQSPRSESLWRASLEVADDLVVMMPGKQGQYRLMAASLCSPSDWRLEEKIGATMTEVHGPIPRLNDEIGGQIDRFFARLPTDRFIQRFNWSLTPRADLMSRDHWQVDPAADALWYRAERQSLRRLPKTGAVAFTIRVHICPLASLKAHGDALDLLWEAIEAAPEDLRHYKGLDVLAPVIANWRDKNRV